MTCEHYWRDGIVLVELGEPDPHRDTCATCRREHEIHDAIIQALPLIGHEATGAPGWEARVWRRIDRLESSRRVRWWYIGAALAAACAMVLTWWGLAHRGPSRPRIEIVPGPSAVAMRSTSPSVGDRVRITVEPTSEVRVYHGDRLVLRCPVGAATDGCLSDAHSGVAEALLGAGGVYRVVVITLVAAEPSGRLDLDLRAIVSAGGEYQITELRVP